MFFLIGVKGGLRRATCSMLLLTHLAKRAASFTTVSLLRHQFLRRSKASSSQVVPLNFFSSSSTDPRQDAARSHLTKTSIRRMRLEDLQLQLQKLGVSDVAGKRRPELQTQLLEALGKSSDRSSSKTKKNNHLNPSRIYVLQVNGYRPPLSDLLTEDAVGIGMVLYQVNDDKVQDPDTFLRDSSAKLVWKGAHYIPCSQHRTSFEAEYAAILWALEYVSVRWGLGRIILQSSNDVVIRMLQGIFDVNKQNLQTFQSKFQKLRQDRFTPDGGRNENRFLQLYSVSSLDNAEALKLAKDAIASKQSDYVISDESPLVLPQDPFRYLEGHEVDGTSPQTKPSLLGDESFAPVASIINERNESEGMPGSQRRIRNEIDPSRVYKLQFDGGSRGNPGLGGSGAVIYDNETGKKISTRWVFHKRNVTNNIAEYCGLLEGLERAKELGIRKLLIEGDSNLVIQQSLGEWKVRNAGLKKVSAQVKELLGQFEEVDMRHIPREENSEADYLANHAMNTRSSGRDAQQFC